MYTDLTISQQEADKLTAISELGGKKASEALSIMTNQELSVEISGTDIAKLEEISKSIGENDLVTAVFLKIQGDLNGGIILLFPEKSGLNMVDLLLKNQSGTTQKLDSMGISALKETGNILVGNYLTAMSNNLHLNVIGSVPDLATDMKDSIMNSIAVELSKNNARETMIFKMQFQVTDNSTSGQMLMFFDAASAEKMKSVISKI
jgi:chemotaxis protein CheC